jgi:hypothetical protein
MQAASGDDLELETRDAFSFLAKQMMAEAGKSQAPLKQDVLKVFPFSLWVDYRSWSKVGFQ